MPRWSCWEDDFSSEDETQNFGTREVVCTNGSIEEWLTLCTFESDDELHDKPVVSVIGCDLGGLCVALDDFLCLFEDQTCSKLLFSIGFGSIVECCCFVSEAEALLIALKSGTVCCVSLQGSIVFENKITVNNIAHDTKFAGFIVEGRKKKNGCHNVLLITSCGDIYRISWNSAPQFKNNSEEVFSHVDTCSRGMVLSVISCFSKKIEIFLIGDCISMWNDNLMDSCKYSDAGIQSYVKAQLWNENMIVCLTCCGKLVGFCTATLVCCKIWTDVLVQDFTFHMRTDTGLKGTISIISKFDVEQDGVFLIVAKFPDFTTIHKIKISNLSWLASNTLNTMYIEGFTSSENTAKLKINVLSETMPQHRLQLLLRKQRFEEAERLAINSGLCVESVLKERANYFANILASKHDPSSLMELLNTLNRIMDIKFITEFCLKNFVYYADDMKILLKYVLRRLQNCRRENGTVANENDFLRLCSQYYKIETFFFLQRSVSFSSAKTRCILNLDWFKICCGYLSKCELKKVMFVWSRHLKDRYNLEKQDIKQLFELIPYSMAQTDVFSWLQLLIPYILDNAPYILEDLLEWIIKRIEAMQENSRDWVNDAESFIQGSVALIQKCFATCCRKTRFFPYKKMDHLTLLLSDVQELKYLFEKYGICLSIKLFSIDNKLEVATNILRKVTFEDVESILTNYMQKFIVKYDLTLDNVLLYFVRIQIAAVSEHWFHFSSDQWESLIIMYINHIVDLDIKMKCIVTVLTYASVPWTKSVLQLASYGSELNHPARLEIRKLQKRANLKLVFKKYGFQADLLESVKFQRSIALFLVKRIIHECQESMVEDALIIASDFPDLVVDVNILCLHHFINQQKYDEACRLFENLNEEISLVCYGRLLARVEIEKDLSVLANYLEFLVMFSCKTHISKCFGNDMKNIKNILDLLVNFNCKITFKDYFNLDIKTSIFKEQVRLLMNCAQDNLDWDLFHSKALLLSQLFGFPPGDSDIEIINYYKETNYPVLELRNCSPEKLGLCSKHLLGSVAQRNGNRRHISIITNTILHGELSLYNPWLHILSWINRARDLSTLGGNGIVEPHDFSLLKVHHDQPRGAWNPEIIEFVFSLFNHMNNFNVENQTAPSVEKILGTYKDANMHIVMISVLNSLICSDIVSGNADHNIKEYQKPILRDLLSKLINSQTYDIYLACSIVFSMQFTDAKLWLDLYVEKFRFRFQKLDRLANVGIPFCKKNKLNEFLQFFINLKQECLWARYFKKYNLQCDKSLAIDKSAVATILIVKNDLGVAEKFCKCFNLDIDALLPLCLESLILSWEPNFEVKKSIDGHSAIVLKSNEDTILKKCVDIAKKIETKTLNNCLNCISKKINCYYYEMFICVDLVRKEVLHDLSAPPFLLLFLRNYQRKSPVGTEEREMWMNTSSNCQDLPPISEWRIPFYPEGMWKVIKLEVTLDTYEEWIQMAEALNTSEDTIRTVALLQSISYLNDNIPCNVEWCTSVRNKRTIEQLQLCAEGISNQERACAALYRICQQVRGSSDKVLIAKLCQERSAKWVAAEGSLSVAAAQEKVNKMYLRLAVTDILHAHNLGLPCYLSKVSMPEALVRELYNHPKILSCLSSGACYWPNVNNAVQKISMFHEDLDLVELCQELLLSWLTPTDFNNDNFDDTVTIRGTLQNLQISSDKENENLLRASYLLKKENATPLLTYLLNKVFQSENEDEVECCKFKKNAIICIMHAVSFEDICMLCQEPVEKVQKHFKSVLCVSELISCGYSITIKKLQNCKIHDIVVELIKCSDNIERISLAAQLAVQYRIYDPEIWKNLLKLMVQHRMAEDLEDTLGKLPCIIPGLPEAWRHLVYSPFIDCAPPLTQEESLLCVQRLKLLYKCPVTEFVDLEHLGSLCFKLERPEWALLLIPLMFKDAQDSLKKKILAVVSASDIKKKLSSIEDDFIVLNIMKIIEDNVENGIV